MALDKSFLDAMEIDEKKIEKILKEFDKEKLNIDKKHNKELLGFSDYEEVKINYNAVVKELDDLKKIDPVKMQEELKNITDKHKAEMETMQKNSNDIIKKIAIKTSLTDAHDPNLILGLIDIDKIVVNENGNVETGLNEQLEPLKKEKSFLFKDVNIKQKGTVPADSDINKQPNGQENTLVNAIRMGAGLQ